MNPPNITLRAPTTDDLPLLFSIFTAAMRDYVTQTFGEWDEADQRRRFYAGFPLDRAQVILADDEVAGAIDMERRADCWSLNNVEIDPRWQRRGIGTALILVLLNRARIEGVPVELGVFKVNPARALYERLGFVEVGQTDTHYLMRADP